MKEKRFSAKTVCLWFTLAVAAVFLLGFGPAGYGHITRAKLILFYAVFGGFAAALMLCACLKRVSLRRKPGLAQLLVLLYWVMTAVSALCSPWREEAVLGGGRDEGLLVITLYAAAFLALSCLAEPGKLMLRVFAAAVSLDCLVCFLQIGGYNPLGLFPAGYGWADRNIAYNGAFLGLTGNADFTASVLSLAFPLFWAAAVKGKKPLYLLPAAASLLVLILGETRGGLLGALLGSLIALPVVLPLGRKGRRVLWLVLLGLFLLGTALVWLLPLPGMLGEAHALLRGKAEDSFGTGRVFIWRNTLPLLGDRVLLGGGADTFPHRMTAQFSRVLADGRTVYRTIDCAHNEYLNIWVNQGLPALAFYLAALVCSLVSWLRRRGGAAGAVLGAAVLCYALQAFFGISTPSCSGFFWVCWGLLEAALAEKAETPEKSRMRR